MRKIIFPIFFMLFALIPIKTYANTSYPWCTDRKVVVAHVNGMLVPYESAFDNLRALRNKILRKETEKLKDFFLKNYFSGYDLKLLYNYHHSVVRDSVEAYIQLTQEAGMTYEEARKTLFLWYMIISGAATNTLNGSPIAKTIAELIRTWMASKLADIYQSQPDLLTQNYEEHKQKIQGWLNKGYPIIFVSHSQGNFFVNAYSDKGWLKPTDNSAPPAVIRVIHLATPATKTALGDNRSPYYTAVEDKVIAKFVNFAAKSGLGINILQPNVQLGCNDCSSELGDWLVHSFTKVYLNQNYPAGNSFLQIVKSNIETFTKEAINEWYTNIIGAPSGDPFYEFNKLALNDQCPICGIDPRAIGGRQIDPPRFEKLTCGSTIGAGGHYQVTTLIVDVSELPKNTTLHSIFEPYYIPDSICISHPPGVEQVKEIKIGRNAGTPNLPLNSYFKVNTYREMNPLTSKVIVIIVGEDPDTAWNFSLSCN
ncbi:hypothetical protein [Persephonella sp.]|uniref:hypothetical protein n=1 Tax=Persephonella sp. TaxID=2060922 RepID=UPI002610C408|nr:hypothetical protein [Persephonella sp.]